MWIDIGLLALVLIFVAYMAIYVRLTDNLASIRRYYLAKAEHPVQHPVPGENRAFLRRMGYRMMRTPAEIYRESVPLMSLLLLGRIGMYFKRCDILAAYNHGKCDLEWNSQPRLLDDLAVMHTSKSRMPTTNEIRGFVQVLESLL